MSKSAEQFIDELERDHIANFSGSRKEQMIQRLNEFVDENLVQAVPAPKGEDDAA